LQSAQENNGSSWIQNFSYDRFGNRNLAAGTTFPEEFEQLNPSNNPTINPNNNRIDPSASGQTSVTYDDAGNLTHDVPGQQFDYDAENKLKAYEGGATVNGGASYSYDGDGRRVKKVVGVSMTATVFVYNILGQLVAEYKNAASGEVGGTSYVTSDMLGSTRLVTSSSGEAKGRHDYLPFGEELFGGTNANPGPGGRKPSLGYGCDPSDPNCLPDGVRQKFTQKERDIETNLDYFLARYYSSTQGRFTSPDDFLNDTHVHDPASWNLYTYVRNNPLKLVDPTGEVVNGAGLTDAERQQLIDDWQRKTGYNRVYFDNNNNLVIDRSAGIARDANGNFLGSADLRAHLTDAIETRDIFNLEHANGSGDVAFARH